MFSNRTTAQRARWITALNRHGFTDTEANAVLPTRLPRNGGARAPQRFAQRSMRLRNVGLSPAQVRVWHSVDLSADSVRVWARAGWAPQDLTALVRAASFTDALTGLALGVRNQTADALSGWATVPLPRERVLAYVRAGVRPSEVDEWEARYASGEDVSGQLGLLTGLRE